MVDYKNASLVIVGSGIKSLSHLTIETKTYICNSDKVLYLVNEPIMERWICNNNPNSESLESIYMSYNLRKDAYQAISNYILKKLRECQHICVVLYGHPMVFSEPAINVITQARSEGFYAKTLPGISAEDCLYADLSIDPGAAGCQSFETTDFLLRNQLFDPTCHLILWQVGVIGVLEPPKDHDNTHGLIILLNYLKKYYPLTHPIVLYEAAIYPHFEPVINHACLEQIVHLSFSTISTLYIPPLGKKPINYEMAKLLNIKVSQNNRIID